MKKFRSRLAIILAMMMVFTSFTFVGVFAENEPQGETAAVAEEPTVTEEPVSADATPTDVSTNNANDQVVLRDAETPEDPPAEEFREDLKIENLRPLSGYNCVVLRWKKIEGIEGVEYVITDAKTGEPVNVNIENYDYIPGTPDGPNLDTTLSGEYLMATIPVSESTTTNASYPLYQYTVQAKVGDDMGEPSTSYTRSPVRTISYRFTVKKGTKLKKHGGNGPSTYNLRKGQTLVCYGFGGGGCYMFKYKGSIFYCAKIRVKKPVALIQNSFNYTREEAQLFLKQKGASSKTNVYLWCSQYTQHFYYLEKTNGQWKCVDDWECSTGKPSAPTPTGMYGIKKIEGKWAKHHNIQWWSKFSGTNSVHGQKPKWTMGRPKSNGCIRNPKAKAQKVYYGAKVGTGLLVF